MKEKTGEVFSIGQDNQPVPGCTISRTVYEDKEYIAYFSLARNTDISAEIFPYHKWIFVNEGSMEVYTNDRVWSLKEGDFIRTPLDTAVGMRSYEACVYTEISSERNTEMNEVIKTGEVYKLAELLPYQEGKIVNMDIFHNEKMKFVIMSFAAGTGLSEHGAPGEAIIFALDGEGIIRYEREDHRITAGENFSFAKGGLHAVKAEKPFKMALLLTLE